jgi:hypothetical protein
MTSRPTPSRLATWVRRYLPSELSGTVAALVAATAVFAATESLVIAAIAATLAEGIGFYGVFGIRQAWRFGHSPRVATRRHWSAKIALTLALTIRSMAVEFGPAELLDTILIRPFFLFAVPALLGPTPLAWLLGKLAADLVFYALAIVSLEVAKPIVEPTPARPNPHVRVPSSRHLAVRGAAS